MRSLSYFLMILLSPGEGLAAGKLPVCPTINQLDEKIISCGDDEVAAQKARECADTIIASWKLAAEGLKATLEASGSSQSVSEKEAKADYERTMHTIESQIASMQDGTDLVADYVLVMVDYPDSNDDKNSLSCFNENFHKVESIVKELDDEIVRAKEIYELAKLKHASSSEREGKLDNSIFDAAVLKGAPLAKKGQFPRSLSDITGTENKQNALTGASESAAQKLAKVISPVADVREGSSAQGKVNSISNESAITGSLYPSSPSGPAFGRAESPGHEGISGTRHSAVSVGELIWNEKDVGTLSLEEKKTPAETASEAPAADRVLASQSLPSAPAPDEFRRAVFKAALFSKSAGDLTLFQLVSRRYRATELFR